MVIDIHAHLWDGSFDENKREILNACEQYNIDKVYISSLGVQFPSEDEIAGLNRETARFVREAPDRIGGFCYISPVHGSAMHELKKGIEEYGMSGMKLWIATYCDDPRVFPLVEKCIDYHIPILVHAFHKAVGQLECESLGINVAKLAETYPEAKIIMAHLGANCYRELKPVCHLKNVSVDISGSIFRGDDVNYAKKMVGADRILFGSDMPGASFLVNYGQIKGADLDENERDLIFYKNALKILERG